jgi:hypothetical protein
VDQEISLVSELISASGAWNERLIRDLFLPIDAEVILRLPMGRGDLDFWAWDP